jgi:hypothetical protein
MAFFVGLVIFVRSDICASDICAQLLPVMTSFWLTELRGKGTKLGEGER